MASLPTELTSIQHRLLFRDVQLCQLMTLLDPTVSSPTTIVIYGPEGTGKSSVLYKSLEIVGASHGIVDCSQCINFRHLLTKAYATCRTALGHPMDWEMEGKCDSLNALAVKMNALVYKKRDKLFLVCDSIDQQREISSSQIAALARLGQVVTNLTVVLVTRSVRRITLHGCGIPWVRFPDFTRDEAISIIARKNPPPSSIGSSSNSTVKWYPHFVTAVYDSLIGPTTLSLSLLGQACEKLWPRFIQPQVDGEKPPGRSKAWDFSKLLVRNRVLFQVEAEPGFDAHLINQHDKANPNAVEGKYTREIDGKTGSQRNATRSQDTTAVKLPQPLLLRYFSALVFIAAYLASHTSPKLDILLFSRLSSSSRKIKKSYHRRKLFQSPTRSRGAPSNANGTSMASSVAVLHKNLVRSFSLDRLVSIVRAIHPHGVPHRRTLADKVASELAELVRLKLVTLIAGDWAADERLTVNVSKGWVDDVAHHWNIDWKDFQI